MSETVITEVHQGVATVTLNRPDVHNAYDDHLVDDLLDALHRLRVHPEVRAVVLTARGRHFCTGADLNWLQRTTRYSDEQNLADARRLAELMDTLNTLPKPTVVKVQGAAFGGGVGLIACCDIAIASQTASFCLSEVRLGLIPAILGPYVLNAIGERQARRYFLSAERFDARQALRIGLVHEVAPPETLDERVEQLLQTLADNGPLAMAATKALIRTVNPRPLGTATVEETARRFAQIRASKEAREGIEAFLNRRKPQW